MTRPLQPVVDRLPFLFLFIPFLRLHFLRECAFLCVIRIPTSRFSYSLSPRPPHWRTISAFFFCRPPIHPGYCFPLQYVSCIPTTFLISPPHSIPYFRPFLRHRNPLSLWRHIPLYPPHKYPPLDRAFNFSFAPPRRVSLFPFSRVLHLPPDARLVR